MNRVSISNISNLLPKLPNITAYTAPETLRDLRRIAHERKWNPAALVIDVDPLTLL